MKISSYPASNRRRLDISGVSIYFDTHASERHGAVSLYRDRVHVATVSSLYYRQFSKAMLEAKPAEVNS